MGGIESNGPTPEDLDEAYKINDQINRGEIKSADEVDGAEKVDGDTETADESPEESAENAPEFELTPEIEAKIMAKVQDILKNGTAVHETSTNTDLDKFLRGYERKQEEHIDRQRKETIWDPIKKAYVHKSWSKIDKYYLSDEEISKAIHGQVKKIPHLADILKEGLFSTDIITTKKGDPRLLEKEENIGHKPDRKTEWAYDTRRFRNTGVHFNIVGESIRDLSVRVWSGDSVKIIFDTSSFKHKDGLGTYSKPGKSGTYVPMLHKNHETGLISHMYGFKLYHRLKPKYLTGLVISADSTIPDGMQNYKEEIRQTRFESVIKTQVETLNGRPEQLLPVYNEEGNLLWPKQMRYEEVKQFVKDRDRGKEETE